MNKGCCLLTLMKHVMNSQLSFLSCGNTCMLLASSPVYRRQQFLIRSLGVGIDHHIDAHSRNMQGLGSVEVDAERIIRSITPALHPSRHKGQAGTQFLVIPYDPFCSWFCVFNNQRNCNTNMSSFGRYICAIYLLYIHALFF